MGIFGINPHIEMGNYDNFPYGNGDFGHPRFHIGKVQSLTRSRIISVTIWGLTEKIPKWKWFPYGDPHRHIEIPVWKWAGRKKNYHLGNPNYRILSATIWVITYTHGFNRAHAQSFIGFGLVFLRATRLARQGWV